MPVSRPAIEVEDLADGGQVRVTITDSDPLATNAVYYARITGDTGAMPWVFFGSRIDDGDMTGVVAPGLYLWHCMSETPSGSVVSDVIYQRITDGAAALHEQILQAVAERAALALSGTDFVVQRLKIPFDGNIVVPACIVTAFDQVETDEGGTSAHDDVGRPVLLALVTNDAHDDETEAQLHQARQRLRRAFTRRLPGVPEVLRCEIESSQVLLLQRTLKHQYQQSTYVVRCICREPVGLTA